MRLTFKQNKQEVYYISFWRKRMNKGTLISALVLLLNTSLMVLGAERVQLQSDKILSGTLVDSITRANEANNKTPSVELNISCNRGDYLSGFIDSGKQRMTLEVMSRSGEPSQRLIDDKQGKNYFYAVAKHCDEVWRLSGVGSYQIKLEQRISLKEQVAPTASAPLSPTIKLLTSELKNGGDSNLFWQKIKAVGTPLIEETSSGTVMTFLVRGNYNNVKLLGAPSNNHESLKRLSNSDTWYKSFIVPNDTHLSYQIAPDVPQPPTTGFARRIAIKAVLQQDPYNHYPWLGIAADKYAQLSTISLKNAPQHNWLHPLNASPKGSLSTFSFTSTTLNNTRDITVYTPAIDYKNRQDTMLLYIFDAKAYLKRVNLPTILDNLIAQNKLPPTVAIFISNPDDDARARELPANDLFADVLAQDLTPKINKQLGITVPAKRTIIAGSSYGGLAATTIALRHPQVFGNVLSISGSYWWSPKKNKNNSTHYVATQVINRPKQPLRFFLSAGLFETSREVDDGILETNRHLRDVLLAKGYETYHKEYGAAHDYFAWRGIIGEGLLTLFPVENNK